MDQKQDSVSKCCDAPVQPKPPMSLEQAQIELVMSERDLVLAERVYKAADQAYLAASRAEEISKLNRHSAESRRNYYREMVTKAARAMLFGLCLLLPRFALAQTITIPVTVPPPQPLTVTVPKGTKIVSGGVTYLVVDTFTFALTAVAPDVTPPPSTGISFSGYRDRNRNVVTTVAAGDTLLIQGSGFGVAGSTVTIGGVAARVASQSDSEIAVTVPNVPGAAVVVVNGVTDTYPLTVTIQTMLLPGTAPGDLAPYDWPPFVSDFRDALGAHVEKLAPGDSVTLVGNSFGDLGGVIWVGNEVARTTSWTDEQIRLTLDPVSLAPSPNGSVWVLQRSSGAHGVAWGPAILPKPAG